MDDKKKDRSTLPAGLYERASQLDWREAVPFESISVRAGTEAAEPAAFDAFALDAARADMDAGSSVLYYRPLSGGRLSVLLRKVLRKLLFFLLEPMSQDISGFNIASVRAVDQLSAFAREQAEENSRNREKIAALERRLAELEKRGE